MLCIEIMNFYCSCYIQYNNAFRIFTNKSQGHEI